MKILTHLSSVCDQCGHNESFHIDTAWPVSVKEDWTFCLSPACKCQHSHFVRQILMPSTRGGWCNTLRETSAKDIWQFVWDPACPAKYISTISELKVIQSFRPDDGPELKLGQVIEGFKILGFIRCENGENFFMMRQKLDLSAAPRTIKVDCLDPSFAV